jgi:prepilin-type N-terminal cleavage/methylation domain-containing protein
MNRRPAQLRPAQLRPAQLRPAQLRPAQLRPAQLRPAQLCPAQLRTAQLCPAQLRTAQLRAAQNVAGFTLVEVVLAIVVLSVLLLGMHSAMLLAWRASPQRDSVNSATTSAAAAIDLLASELALATSITAATDSSVRFVVPDRTGDGAPDTIQYSWSGSKGDPLLRTINNAAATVAANLAEFQLTYEKRSQPLPTTYTESGEVTLSYYDSLNLLNLGNFAVKDNQFVGQCFKPSLPHGATHWRVTRTMLRMRSRGSTGGETRIQLRGTNGTTPTTILEEVLLLESSLGSAYSWREFTFSNVGGRPAGSSLCLVAQWSKDADACDIEYQNLLASAGNSDLVQTTNGGATWTAPAGQDLQYYIYGTYSTPDPVEHVYWLTGVGCALRCGNDAQARVQTTIRLLNEPQVPGP